MKKLVMLLCIGILGAIGWQLGMLLGIGFAWALSSLGSLAGVYAGWRINRAWLE
ncbi:MAG TPA: hypothetical protein VFM15_00810 [Gammaproteobacteria bacterium]|nr:hypothetical protein [Gammaproteobacteria bacterium]